MSSNDFITLFDRTFAGRRDVYAVGYQDPKKENKYRYRTEEGHLDAAALLKHLKGEHIVGVYPIMSDNTVSWFAVDFDAPKDDDGNQIPDAFELAFSEAKKQLQRFESAGLQVYLERSRSGAGVHIWGFLDAPLPAELVRQAILPLLDPAITLDRVFPLQDALTEEKPLGNLIALPFHGTSVKAGNSVFLTEEGEVIPPREFLAQVRRNAPAVIESLSEAGQKAQRSRQRKEKLAKGPQESRSRSLAVVGSEDDRREYLTGALKMFSPMYGCKFMRHCWEDRKKLSEPEWYVALQQCTMFENGRELAHIISRDYKGYNAAEVDAKYDQALNNRVAGCKWIHENAPAPACQGCPMTAPYRIAERSLLELAHSAEKPVEGFTDWGPDVTDAFEMDAGRKQSGIKWEDPSLDRFSRLRPGELIVFGAQPSMGKTAWMLDRGLALSRAGVPVLIVSAETGRQTLRQRVLANAAQVDSSALRGERISGRLTAAEKARLTEAAAELAQLPLFFDFASVSADRVMAQVESTVLRFGLPLDAPLVVFFDYLQYGAKKEIDDSDYERLSRLISEFKALAKITSYTVVVLSQLRRQTEGDENPEITWFKGTGRIEADGDILAILTGERSPTARAPRSLWIVKQKEGTAHVKLDYTFHQEVGTFDPVGLKQYEQPKPLELTSPDAGFGE